MMKKRFLVGAIFGCLAVSGLAFAQLAFTKAQVADRIRKVEDGVDEFRKWSENRAEKGHRVHKPRKRLGALAAVRRPSRRKPSRARRKMSWTTRSAI